MDGLTDKIRDTYRQAAWEIRRKLDRFTAAHRQKSAQMLAQVKAGKLSMDDYRKWLQGQVFVGERWREKLDDVTRVYAHADEVAREAVGRTAQNEFVRFANQTARDIEHDFGGAVSFDMYDSATVERLLQDNPRMLPEWRIDEPKDYTWNEQRVQNAVTQGIIQGEPISDIADRLCTDLATSNAKKMDNFARTAVTGAQNAGRIDRMHQAQEMGIRVQKKWLASHDDRVRDSHAELDGTAVDVDEDFVTINGNHIAYPGDPSAPPEEVYNCRCTLLYVYPDFEESAEAVQEETEETEEKELSEPGSIANIRERVANHIGEWTTQEIEDVGKDVGARIDERVTPAIEAAQERATEYRRQASEWLERADDLNNQMIDARRSGDTALYDRLRRQKRDAIDRYVDLRAQAIAAGNTEAVRAQVVQDVIAEIRPIGGVTADNVEEFADFTAYSYNVSRTRAKTVEAMNRYPSSWLEESKNYRTKLTPHWTRGRAYYMWDGEIRFDNNVGTNVHELGHRMEHVMPQIRQAEAKLYAERTAGEPLEWLGRGYDRSEKTRRDSWIDPYMGKEYDGTVFEIVSMGFQYALTEPSMLDRDPQFKHWILGVLAGM